MGLVRAVERQGLRCGFLKPIAQSHAAAGRTDRSVAYVRAASAIRVPEPIDRDAAEALLARDDEQVLMEQVVERCQEAALDADVVIVEGMVPGDDNIYSTRLNHGIAKGLDADVVLVAAPDPRSVADTVEAVGISARGYGSRVVGVVLNRLGFSQDRYRSVTPGGEQPLLQSNAADLAPYITAFAALQLKVIGAVPRRPDLTQPRFSDVAAAVGARALSVGDPTRRVERTILIARTVVHALDAMVGGSLLVTPGDREDILMAAAMVHLQGARFAGIILTGDLLPDPRVLRLCQPALDAGLSISVVPTDSYTTAAAIHAMDREIPVDDVRRLGLAMDAVANQIDATWIRGLMAVTRESRLSPPAFRYRLIERARVLDRRIILPEGDEPRTVAAAAICAERGIARCVLLGDPDRIRAVAQAQGVTLPPSVEILDAAANRERLVVPLMELRKAKGMTADQAREYLQDTVVIGTMLLKLGEVDGLVSGAVHTTANTIRPALQLIKLQPGMKLASSVFFMCLPEQVLVFGDCAVNPAPTAEELADIAIQSADSAAAFGIPPRVAMLSYSTGVSGAGPDVEKVAQATKIAKERRPDLAIDGPLQYDAAIQPEVAKSKAPNSAVAGKATVFVFPDLNAGNTGYKAVQRSTGCISIGPMMQGMAKPVNDLSRGCLIEDIVFTIALTAIQSG
jgi:phosphate acetyltransferase